MPLHQNLRPRPKCRSLGTLSDAAKNLAFRLANFSQKGILNMNLAIKSAVAAALLGAVSMSAFAATVNVTPPPTGPVPNPGITNGGLMAEILDTATNHYLTVYLGGDMGTFKAQATPSGGVTFDYGVMTG